MPAFIFTVLQDCFPQEEREAFVAGLNQLDEACEADQRRNFLKLSIEKQVAFLKKTDSEANATEKSGSSLALHQATWLRLKELTLVGYFTSEIGASQALEYIPVPGRLETCIDMPQGQKAWAVG